MEGRERKRGRNEGLTSLAANGIPLPQSPLFLLSHYYLRFTGYTSRFKSRALSITFLTCFSLTSVCASASQDNLPPVDDGDGSGTDVVKLSKSPANTQESALEKEKKSKSQLDPDNTSPEEGKVIGDGDEIFVQDNIVQIPRQWAHQI